MVFQVKGKDLKNNQKNWVSSIVMAAGRGSRMKGYDGNKTLLPLVQGTSITDGEQPILLHIFDNLPPGPKAVVVHHKKEHVMEATFGMDVSHIEQPVLNGTGGAILAAESFIKSITADCVIITMGDVPFVKKSTYDRMIEKLSQNQLMILGFCPKDKKKYGILEIEDGKVHKITEWKYWSSYTSDIQDSLSVCNSGIYAVQRETLLQYLPLLASEPQVVIKEVNGRHVEIEEFFITDLVEYMVADGLPVGYVVAEDEIETMGIDDMAALKTAQAIFRKKGGF